MRAETVYKGNKKENYTWGTYKYMQEGQASHLYVNKYTFDDKLYTNACWYSNGVFVGDNGDGKEHRDLASYDLEDDAARQNWRSTWRMPTLAEFKWLLDNCTWTWTPDYNGTGVKGYTVTSKVEGFTENSLFFPAAGVLSSVGLEPGLSGRYWSSSSGSHPVYGAVMYFNHGVSGISDSFGYNISTTRLTGLPVRPVAD